MTEPTYMETEVARNEKRILSILLALCMLFCLVPTTAFAEGETSRKVETEQELVDALADSSADIITLKMTLQSARP